MTQILIDKKEEIEIIHLSGRFIGGDETDALREKLRQLSNENLVIDLSKVSYMNSTALGILISAQSIFITNGKQIVLLNASESVSDLLYLTQLNLVFKVIENFEEVKNIINN